MDFRRIRINSNIRGVKEVRVIDEKGQQLGVMPIQAAFQKAQELGTDIIEVAPTATPPVCRIMDFSKFKYLQEKKEKEHRKHQRMGELKEIYIRSSIFEHDLQTKLNHIKEFLQHSHATRIIITFMGREIEFMETNAKRLVEKITSELSAYGNIDRSMREKNKVVILVTPKKNR